MAMLGIDDYLCEACANFNTDGIDGNHPSCSKQKFAGGRCKCVRVGETCPYGFEAGVPSGYPVSMKRNKERYEKIIAMLGTEVD